MSNTNFPSEDRGVLPGALARIARDIILSVTQDLPADQALRQVLSKQQGMSRDHSRNIARAVFAFYRWKGWLEQPEPFAPQLRECLQRQIDYDAETLKVSDAEMLRCAVPPWVGEVMTPDPTWLRAIQHEPSLWLRARPGKVEELETELMDCINSPILACGDATEYRGVKDLFRHKWFQEGQFEIQDLSSQVVGVVSGPKAGETWWDACAGEGGKLLHMSDLMGNRGMIWATDRSEWRLKRLKQRTARAKVFNYRAALWPKIEHLPTRTKFDGVLVDAPCSGIGTWQRNPHARWTLDAADVNEMAEVQRRILTAVIPSLKPGGRLVYSVCTLSKPETLDVVEWVGKQFPSLKPEPWTLEGLKPQAEEGGSEAVSHHHTLWPQDFSSQGMFIAQWRV